jgi:hypothetical protein
VNTFAAAQMAAHLFSQQHKAAISPRYAAKMLEPKPITNDDIPSVALRYLDRGRHLAHKK